MGVHTILRLLFVFYINQYYYLTSSLEFVQNIPRICQLPKCNCATKTGELKTINCSLDNSYDLVVAPNDLPSNTFEIYFYGGRKITFQTKSLENLLLVLISINGTHRVIIEKRSMYNLASPSLLLDIQNCDYAIVKSGAFDNVNSAIKSEFSNCGVLELEESAFCNLNHLVCKHVSNVILAPRSFQLKGDGHIGKHGPVTNIAFENVTIPRIPQFTFYSSLAEIRITNSRIDEVECDAIRAIQIAYIYIFNTTINVFKRGSLSDGTMILGFIIERCTIHTLESNSIEGGIQNFTIQYSHITSIESGAVSGTVLNMAIMNNDITDLQSNSLVFHNWIEINIKQNVIKNLGSSFLVVTPNTNMKTISFVDNEVYSTAASAFSYTRHIENERLVFKANFFEQACYCAIREWFTALINDSRTEKTNPVLTTSFCRLNSLFADCFNLSTNIINVQNFTVLICHQDDTVICTTYRGRTKELHVTDRIAFTDSFSISSKWWLASIFAVVLAVSLMVGIVKCWLRRAAQWQHKNVDYSSSTGPIHDAAVLDSENDDETGGPAVVVAAVQNIHVNNGDEPELLPTLDVPDEITLEFLRDLAGKLENPDTHQGAAHMIERLYEMFIVDNENNYDVGDDEDDGISAGHLYEDLNKMNTLHDKRNGGAGAGAREGAVGVQAQDVLKFMERRMNNTYHNNTRNHNRVGNVMINLVEDYSEPSDAEQHLYSELKRS